MLLENFILENIWLLLLAALWTIPWKGTALWKSSRNNQKAWFIALLVTNTLAVLEIIYIFGFSQPKKEINQRKGAPNG